jgi:Domain of unknown function (DUF2382)
VQRAARWRRSSSVTIKLRWIERQVVRSCQGEERFGEPAHPRGLTSISKGGVSNSKKGLEERTVEVSATVERPVISKEARVVEEVAVGKTARDREEVVRDIVRRSKIEVEEDTRASDKVGS